MKVSIDEEYPGELEEKGDDLIKQIRQRMGHTEGCTCGCVSKAVSGADKPVRTKEESPFLFIRMLQKNRHMAGKAVAEQIVDDVVNFIEARADGM
jgi:hypothetical protein